MLIFMQQPGTPLPCVSRLLTLLLHPIVRSSLYLPEPKVRPHFSFKYSGPETDK